MGLGFGMAKGAKKRKEKFVGIFAPMYRSDVFNDLSPYAVRILMELKWRYNGYNNGEIGFSIREGVKLCAIGTEKSKKAILELLTHGFIRIRKIGRFTTNESTEFELTFEPYVGRPARHDWKYWPANEGNKIRAKNLHEYLTYLSEYRSTQINQLE